MIEQLKTIREALEQAKQNTTHSQIAWNCKEALTALTQLEAMVGEQEPVAWCPALTYPGHEKDRAWANGKPRKEDIEYWTLNGKGITYAYAAPAAKQYEAGDMASAAAQGFRDGVASVTQQEPVAWAMPKGDGTFIDVITPAEHAREEGSYTVPLFARPVAQQPQAEAVPTVQIVNCDTCKHSANSCDDYPCNRCGVEFGDGPFNRWEAPQQAEAVPSDVVRDVESAAKKMAEIFDYPWDFMPEKGRNTMRENVRAVLDAAIAQQKGGV